MCTPALAIQAAGAGMNAVGSYAGAAAQQASLRSQARISEINATMADAAGRAELMASERQQNQIYLRGAQVKASQTSAYAANGIDVGVGTPVNVATSADYVTQVDANTAAANGIQAAWGRRIEAGNYRRQAVSQRATASGISPGMAAFSSLLSSASQVASSWYTSSKSGALGGSSGGGQSSQGGMLDAWVNDSSGAYKTTADGIRVRW